MRKSSCLLSHLWHLQQFSVLSGLQLTSLRLPGPRAQSPHRVWHSVLSVPTWEPDLFFPGSRSASLPWPGRPLPKATLSVTSTRRILQLCDQTCPQMPCFLPTTSPDPGTRPWRSISASHWLQGWLCHRPVGAGFFLRIKNGELCPCIEYCSLNTITICNKYPLLLLDAALSQL